VGTQLGMPTSLILSYTGKIPFHGTRRNSARSQISRKGTEVDKAKIEAIERLPRPRDVKGIRSFLDHE
jgi:hypothetical protein